MSVSLWEYNSVAESRRPADVTSCDSQGQCLPTSMFRFLLSYTWCVTELWVLAAPEGAYHVTPLILLGRSAEAFGPAVLEKKPLNAGVCMVPLS